jgi:hypothetical protein
VASQGVFPYVSRILVVSVRHAKRPKRAGEAGTRQKPPDQAEPDPDGASGTHEPHEAGSASAVPAEVSAPTGKTTTGSPRPEASGREPHDPEPEPEKQAEGEDEGPRPAGHVEETNPTKPRPGGGRPGGLRDHPRPTK